LAADKPIRLIGVGISNLDAYARQLSLWDTTSERSQKLQEAVDGLQSRFGKQAIHRGKY
jgi:hypothetical protein